MTEEELAEQERIEREEPEFAEKFARARRRRCGGEGRKVKRKKDEG
jgi:hypothetical protein